MRQGLNREDKNQSISRTSMRYLLCHHLRISCCFWLQWGNWKLHCSKASWSFKSWNWPSQSWIALRSPLTCQRLSLAQLFELATHRTSLLNQSIWSWFRLGSCWDLSRRVCFVKECCCWCCQSLGSTDLFAGWMAKQDLAVVDTPMRLHFLALAIDDLLTTIRFFLPYN